MNSRTPALEAVDASGVPHGVVRFEPAPDLATAAERRGIPVAQLLKTMVVRIAEGSYLLVLVPGDRVIDWKALRSHVGVRRLALADADEAFALTGYRRGTITPFGAQGGAPWSQIRRSSDAARSRWAEASRVSPSTSMPMT